MKALDESNFQLTEDNILQPSVPKQEDACESILSPSTAPILNLNPKMNSIAVLHKAPKTVSTASPIKALY